VSGFLLSRHPRLREMDVAFHCNNPKMSRRRLLFWCSAFRNPRMSLFLTDKNIGYIYGAFEAIAGCFNFLQEFDLVVHMHPDVFIVDPAPFLALLDSIAADESRTDFYVSFMRDHVTPADTAFCFDFFAFRPSPAARAVFAGYAGEMAGKLNHPERFLARMLQETGLSKKIVPRAQWRGGHRKIDELGLWHEHSYRRVVKYFLTRNWVPKMGTKARAWWHNDFYLKPEPLTKLPDAPSNV